MKFNHQTGERLKADDIHTIPALTMFAQQEIGVDLPLGNGRRQGWMRWCKTEMAEQGWQVEDLVVSVRYIKQFSKPCRSPQGILWYVKDAREWQARAGAYDNHEDLHLKVAMAINNEVDETWVRRLSIASGKALEIVYRQWEERNELMDAEG